MLPPITALPWPIGVCPAAFANKTHDTNTPESIDPVAFRAAVDTAVAQASAQPGSMVLIESFHLLHFPAIVSQLDGVVRLDVDCAAQHILMERKYTRDHLGQPSYAKRGVSLAEYQVYWDACVWTPYCKYRTMEPALAATMPMLVLDALAPLVDSISRIFAWSKQVCRREG